MAPVPRFLHDSEQKEGALAAGVFVQGTDGGLDRNGVALGAAGVAAAAGSACLVNKKNKFVQKLCSRRKNNNEFDRHFVGIYVSFAHFAKHVDEIFISFERCKSVQHL